MHDSPSRPVTVLSAISPEELIPSDHPIRTFEPLGEEALRALEPTFATMCAQIGCPSIPTELLLTSCPPMAVRSVLSERRFCGRLRHGLVFHWSMDLNLEDKPLDHFRFPKYRRRLVKHRVIRKFFEAVVGQAEWRHVLSSHHFTADWTLLKSWASTKSLPLFPREDKCVFR